MFRGYRSRIKAVITPMRKDFMSPSFRLGLEKVKMIETQDTLMGVWVLFSVEI